MIDSVRGGTSTAFAMDEPLSGVNVGLQISHELTLSAVNHGCSFPQ